MIERKSIKRKGNPVDLTACERWIIKMALENALSDFPPQSTTHADVTALLEKFGGRINE